MTVLRYRGFEGTFAFDPDAELFHGDVNKIRDAVTFQARTLRELPPAFAESVDDYLEFCAVDSRPSQPR
jgi:predicted HicB family RNase H-like nuclease